MSYRWIYLWASADVDLTHWRPGYRDHLGPTTLTWLADETAANLIHKQRFTVHFGRRSKKSDPGTFHGLARKIADTLLTSVRQRHPELCFDERFRIISRTSAVLQFIPRQEWHPDFHRTDTAPRVVSCDASWKDSAHVRAGITGDRKASVSINLAPAHPHTSGQAEFLGVCLAMLTGAAERIPLLVRCDNTSAVAEAHLLGKGIMPSWMYRESTELAQRIAIAAMTSMRIRPVVVKQVQRAGVSRAHEAAAYHAPEIEVLHPRTWAKKQGTPLGWLDVDRGLIRP